MKADEREIARRLYTPPASDLIKNLTDLGDGLSGQFAALQRSPTASGCEQLATNLQGASWVVMRIRQGLLADEELARAPD